MSGCRWEREILLEASGELPARRQAALQRHLGACAACRAYRAVAGRLTGDAARVLRAHEPAGAVLTRIRARAADRPAPRFRLLPAPAVRALACAAVLALALGGWVYTVSQRQDARIDAVSAVLAVVSEPDADPEAANGAASPALQALADDLLRLEGFADEPEALDLLMGFGEPTPTAFQTRSVLEPA